MATIRCTAKLRHEMGLKPADLAAETEDSLLGEWYAHLFYEARKKCVLLASDTTLLCVLAPNLTRDRARRLDGVLRDGLFRVLLDEGFSAGRAEPVLRQLQRVRYAATSDRSMVGTLTEMVNEARFWLPRFGGVASPDLPALHHKLNRNPLKRNGYEFAIDRTKRLLETAAAE